jgi:hypothetical protein
MNNITYLDDLPDLYDLNKNQGPSQLESSTRPPGITQPRYPLNEQTILPKEQYDKVSKHIRGKFIQPPNESGMYNNNNTYPQQNNNMYPQYNQSVYNQQKQPFLNNQSYDDYYDNEKQLKITKMPIGSPTCIECADHITNCPICSKFYNNDKTLYILIISILSLICIILLKKVLDS